MFESFSIKTTLHEEIIDITHEVKAIVKRSSMTEGVCFIYTPHTTAAITINENADPTVKNDIIKGLKYLDLESVSFSHREGNSPAHIKSSLIGCSETVFIENNQLHLGTWQGIFFCEFDGPRTRTIHIKIM